MIAKIKKTTTVKEKKSKKLEKKVPKKQNAFEEKPKVKKERVEPPKKLKGISKRFNVEKPSKTIKIKKEVKAEEAEEITTEPPAQQSEKPVKGPGRKVKPYNFGVVQIKCLPHGFYEEQLRGFFKQFGDVHRVRVARSLKTGRSTGVGYVEFKVPEVAEIAANTMNNYLLMKSILKTTYIPPEKVTPRLMQTRVRVARQNGKEVVFSVVTSRRTMAIRKHNAKPTEKGVQKRQKKMEEKVEAKKRQLTKAGIDFHVDSVIKKPKVKPEEASPKKPEKKVKKEVKEKQKKKIEKSSVKMEEIQEEPKKSKSVPKVKKLQEKPKSLKKSVKKKKISIKLAPMKSKKVDSPKKEAKQGLKIKVGQKVTSKSVKKSKKIV